MHRDLKPANILYKGSSNGVRHIMLCDFDMALPLHGNYPSFKAMTPEYTPPEILTAGGDVYYTDKVDIWSIGCVIYHLIKGHHLIKRGSRKDEELDNYLISVQHAFCPGGRYIIDTC